MTVQSTPRWRELFAPAALKFSLQKYQRQYPQSAGMFGLAAAIAEQQAGLAERLEATHASPDEMRNPTDPALGWLVEAIDAIATATAGAAAGSGPALASLAQASGSLPAEAIVAAAGGDAELLEGLAARAGLPPEVAFFVMHAALQPWLAWRHGARPMSIADQPFPARGTCPACGGNPLMGKHVDPDGQRFLRCADCGNEWAYPRIGCPGCGETNAAKIETYFVPEDEGHRIYLCTNCQQYIKISDERLLGGRVYLPLEDIVTLHLDELGAQRGFTSVSQGDSARRGQGGAMSH